MDGRTGGRARAVAAFGVSYGARLSLSLSPQKTEYAQYASVRMSANLLFSRVLLCLAHILYPNAEAKAKYGRARMNSSDSVSDLAFEWSWVSMSVSVHELDRPFLPSFSPQQSPEPSVAFTTSSFLLTRRRRRGAPRSAESRPTAMPPSRSGVPR